MTTTTQQQQFIDNNQKLIDLCSQIVEHWLPLWHSSMPIAHYNQFASVCVCASEWVRGHDDYGRCENPSIDFHIACKYGRIMYILYASFRLCASSFSILFVVVVLLLLLIRRASHYSHHSAIEHRKRIKILFRRIHNYKISTETLNIYSAYWIGSR